MARQPQILAIWPAIWPTDPAAAEITTVSPGLMRPVSISAKYAVGPLVPRKSSQCGRSATSGSTRRAVPAGTAAYSCQPVVATTRSPGCQAPSLDSTTSATDAAVITSPTLTPLV